MSDEHKQYAATAAATLEAHILGVHSAKGEAEWWAQREILRLHAENEKLRAALHRISLGSQNSSETKDALGRAAKAALGESDE